MLTKPISLYPDAVVVNPENEQIQLTATYLLNCSFETEMIGGVEYCYAALIMGDENRSYKVYRKDADGNISDFRPVVTREKDCIKLTFYLDLSDNSDLYGTVYSVSQTTKTNTKGHQYTRLQVNSSDISIKDMLDNKIYKWKVRVYEQNSIKEPESYLPMTEIGYGTVSDIMKGGNQTALTTFPHTNIYDYVLGECLDSKDTNDLYFGETSAIFLHNEDNDWDEVPTATELLYKLNATTKAIQWVDSNAKYYINLNGSTYNIEKYRYLSFYNNDGTIDDVNTGIIDLSNIVNWGAYPMEQAYSYMGNEIMRSGNVLDGGKETKDETGETTYVYKIVQDMFRNTYDVYGNPINGHMLIDGELDDVLNCTYKLLCNFIDSDEAYFEKSSTPILKITETNYPFSIAGDTGVYTTGTETEPYEISYCNVRILVDIVSPKTVKHSYYNYRVFELMDSGKYEVIYRSSNIFNSEIICEYDDFLDDRLYKMLISVVTTKGQTCEREIFFKTNYKYTTSGLMAKAEYYKDHNSVIVDWNTTPSITPTLTNNQYEFVSVNGKDAKSLNLKDDNRAVYSKDDYNNYFEFDNAMFALKFKLNLGSSNIIANLATDDSWYEIRKSPSEYGTDYDYILISTPTDVYRAKIKTLTTLEETIEAISTGQAPVSETGAICKTVVWYDEIVWQDDYVWVEGQNTADDEYLLIIDSVNNNFYLKDLTTGIEFEFEYWKERPKSIPYDNIGTNSVAIYGDNIFSDITVINSCDSDIFNTFKTGSFEWLEKTQMLCGFNDTMNGADISTSANSHPVGFKVYKRIGGTQKLYKIADIATTNYTTVEDFVVGDNCEYQYYIFPVFKDDLNLNLLYTNAPVITEVITISAGINKVFALKEITNNVYCVDTENVWKLQLNLEDTGYTINNSKTFFDTLNQYSQEHIGNLKYISKSISALIGSIDCDSKTNKLTDTYDMLISWNNFVTSGSAKCLIDSRGLILPGNFEANPTVEYIKCRNNYAVAKFNWRQKSDLNVIQIYATVIPYNPLNNNKLLSGDDYALLSSDDRMLYVVGD